MINNSTSKWNVVGKSYTNAGDCLILDWKSAIQGSTTKVSCEVKNHPKTNDTQQIEGDVIENALEFVQNGD